MRRLGPTALPEDHAARGGTTWVVAREVDRERAGREADARARSGAARARRPARCARRAQHGALRHTSAIVNAARVRPQREDSIPISASATCDRVLAAPPPISGLARWVHGRLARPHSRQTAPRGTRPLRRDGRPAARLSLVLGFPAPAVRAGAMLVLADVARLRQRVVAPRGVVALAALGVLVQDPWPCSRWARGCRLRAWARWSGPAAPSLERRASRGSPRRRSSHARHRADQRIRLRYRGADRCAGQSHRDPARRRRGAGLVMALALSWLDSGLAHLIAAGAGLGLALLDLVAHGAALVPGGHIVMVAGGKRRCCGPRWRPLRGGCGIPRAARG